MPSQSVITIRRPVTVVLLLLTTVIIVAVTMWITGKTYAKVDPIPFDDLRNLRRVIVRHPVSTHILAVIVVPVIANTLLFMPWGFLMFIALYTVKRPTLQTYVLTILLGFTFSCVIEGWQYFLPTRVADINDIIWNTVGTFLGAILGHLRERVRFEFA
jgi:glycopeptide antibiotics resistance protein